MKNKTLIFAMLMLLVLAGYIANAEVFSFTLTDGKTVKCEVISASKDILTVKEWLGARGFEKRERTFKWSEIATKDRELLKKKFGIPLSNDLLGDEFIRWGVKIKTTDNKFFEGFVDEEESTEKTLVIFTIDKRKRKIARDRLDTSEKLKVDIRKCMSPTKIYKLLISENYPISAKDHFKLALVCERIGALRQAISHFKKAESKDARYSYASDAVKNRIEGLGEKYNEQFALGLLEDAKRMIKRKKYKEASNLINRILDNYSQTKAAIEAASLQARIKDLVDMMLAKDVVGDYYDLITRLIRKRVTGKVLDGVSQPGFKVSTVKGTFEGVLTDENGNPVPPPSSDELDFDEGDEEDDFQDSEGDIIFIKTSRGITYEIPKSKIKSMEPVELNKKTKEPKFTADHKLYLNGRDSQLNRDIRTKLSFKYGLSEKEIKDMWINRAVERRTIDNKIIRKSLAERFVVRYGKGTHFSPKIRRKATFNGRKGLRPVSPIPMNDDQFFDSLSSAEKTAVLRGIYAENSLIVDEDSIKVTACPTCKGTGKSKKKVKVTPKGGRKGGKQIVIGCMACHGIGAFLSFTAK